MSEKPTIKVTQANIDRLLDELDNTVDIIDDEPEVAEPGDGDQTADLSGSDAVGYALSGQDAARVETVLNASRAAAERMAHLRRGAETWQGAAGQQRLEALGRKLQWASMPWESARASLRQAVQDLQKTLGLSLAHFAPAGAQVSDTESRLLASDDISDGLLRWEIRSAPGNIVTVGIWSSAVALEGTRLRLTAGDWRQECVLTRRAPDAVGDVVKVTDEARQRFAGRGVPALVVDVVDGGGDPAV